MSCSIAVSDFVEFRAAARPLVAAGVAPSEVFFCDAVASQQSLFAPAAESPALAAAPVVELRVPRRYVHLAENAALYRDPDRFAVLYRVLYRLCHGEAQLLDDEADADVRELTLRARSVWQDEHRMHAFVRFRKLTVELPGAGQTEHYCAWYEPEHHIVRLVAPFFQRRYGSLLWSILTPDESVHWNGDALQYGPGAERSQAPGSDELEALYSAYYAATYNPARKNPALFRKHVPAAFVRHMPELDQLPALFALGAPASCAGSDGQTAAPLVPEGADLAQLRAAAQHCRACAACELGSQVVFGVGPSASRICLIGEQPGDEEDQRGVPFVGPAGRVLDRALAEAGLDRETLYLTNSVKHFNYIQRGKRRLHQKPHLRIVHACKPWLEAELAALRPHTIVCLGATAARSLLGPRFSIKANFGRTFETPWAEAFMATYHPAAILRMNEPEASAAYSTLVRDLVRARLHTESPQLGVAP